MKTSLIVILAAIATALSSGCSRPATAPAGGSTAKVQVLCSTFPMYLFTRNVTAGREEVGVDLMIPAAMGCPHDYALTPQDMRKIAAAGVFVANGLGMEEFLGEPLKRGNDKIVVVDTSAGIDDLIQIEEEHHDGREGTAGHMRHFVPNPHLFACPKMAARIVRNIAEGLSKADPAGAEVYKRNAAAYAARLEKLSNDFVAATKELPSKKIVTEHAVFDYLAHDCGLTIVAVIEENPGQEPAAAEMTQLVKTIKSSGASAVFTEPQYPAKVSQTIAKEVGIPVAAMDPVATGPDNAPLDYYETTMRANLATLVKTLGGKK
jgi:zinc transport system substrate-binding protein